MNPDSVSAQVPVIAGGVSESTEASTTKVQNIIFRRRRKTNAQLCREYRERKKLQNTMVPHTPAERAGEWTETGQLPAKRPMTNAERRRKHYAAQKLKKQGTKKIPKTRKQRNKEYNDRKKIKALNNLNHHSDALYKQNNICSETTKSVESPTVFIELTPVQLDSGMKTEWQEITDTDSMPTNPEMTRKAEWSVNETQVTAAGETKRKRAFDASQYTPFTKPQEEELVKRLIVLSNKLDGLTEDQLRRIIFLYAEHLELNHKFRESKRFGKAWTNIFLKRHHLAFREPEANKQITSTVEGEVEGFDSSASTDFPNVPMDLGSLQKEDFIFADESWAVGSSTSIENLVDPLGDAEMSTPIKDSIGVLSRPSTITFTSAGVASCSRNTYEQPSSSTDLPNKQNADDVFFNGILMKEMISAPHFGKVPLARCRPPARGQPPPARGQSPPARGQPSPLQTQWPPAPTSQTRNTNAIYVSPSLFLPIPRPAAADATRSEMQPRVVSSIDSSKLIGHVKKHPIIWSRVNPQNRSSIHRAWEEINTQFPKHNVETLKKRWKNLKDHYRKELKRGCFKADEPQMASWAHMEEMVFIKDEIINSMLVEDPRPSPCASPRLLAGASSPSPQDDPPDQDMLFLNPSTSGEDSKLPQTRNLKKLTDIKQQFLEIEAKKLKILEEEVRRENEFRKSDNYHFLMSLLPEMEKMSSQQRHRLKVKMLDAVYSELQEPAATVNEPVEIQLTETYNEITIKEEPFM